MPEAMPLPENMPTVVGMMSSSIITALRGSTVPGSMGNSAGSSARLASFSFTPGTR